MKDLYLVETRSFQSLAILYNFVSEEKEKKDEKANM